MSEPEEGGGAGGDPTEEPSPPPRKTRLRADPAEGGRESSRRGVRGRRRWQRLRREREGAALGVD